MLISFHFILTGTDCSLEAENTIPVPAPLAGGSTVIICPLNHCLGEYIFEHHNHNTLQYEIVYQGMRKTNVTIRTLSDAGYFRCSRKCSDSRPVSQYCYFKLVSKLRSHRSLS